MDLSFESKSVRSLCERSKTAAKTLGDEVARELQARVAELEAAEQLSDFLQIMGLMDVTKPGDVLIPLTSGASVVITPYLRVSGGGTVSLVNTKEVTRVMIKGVRFTDG